MLKKSHYCGKVTEELIGNSVIINGWVHKRRDLGNLIFVMARDVTGIVQIVFDPSVNSELCDRAVKLSQEFVVGIKGNVIAREESNINPDMKTGKIEIKATELEILAESEVPPFVVAERETAAENTRLKYRYLDIRRPNISSNLVFRSQLAHAIREFLINDNFHEVETPILIKSTPEGARDYVVPCRVQQGKFYALPQSPQLLKQLLMVSGMDRYFQFSRCFRDEDLRADRQPEFTQIDLEMSFVEESDVMTMCENMLSYALKKAKGVEIKTPFQRMPYKEAMERFGSDKPDLRFELELLDIGNLVKDSGFKVFQNVLAAGGRVGAIALSSPRTQFSRKVISGLEDKLKKDYGIGGLAFVKVENSSMDAGVSKFLSDTEKSSILKKAGITDGIIFIIADNDTEKALSALGRLRNNLADMEELIKDKDELNFVWINEFPLFERDDENKRFAPKHHIFSHPRNEHIELLNSDPLKVHGYLYDLVLNGVELGSGSIRINSHELQKKMLKLIDMSEQEANERFGFLMDSFRYGAPPHGGFAFGYDRLVMILVGDDSIRDIIAFPKTVSGSCQLTGAPDSIGNEQLDELGISLK